MANQPIDCTESMFRSASCVGCGTHVVAAVDYNGEPMCLECRRTGEGIDWESQDLIGEWHPAVGYSRELQWHPPRGELLPVVGAEWRWACVRCRMNGPADTASHAAHLIRMHDTFACPATAPARPPRPAPRSADEAIRQANSPDEHALRVARRADLTRNYPEQAPAWVEQESAE